MKQLWYTARYVLMACTIYSPAIIAGLTISRYAAFTVFFLQFGLFLACYKTALKYTLKLYEFYKL